MLCVLLSLNLAGRNFTSRDEASEVPPDGAAEYRTDHPKGHRTRRRSAFSVVMVAVVVLSAIVAGVVASAIGTVICSAED